MIKVKAFHTENPQLLSFEEKINKWLEELQKDDQVFIEIVKIDHAFFISPKNDTHFIIMVWYKVN
jgi:aromatic ring-opening dioxygenase catalytic subunit (LigB family)